jgi:hypothetical protein
MLCKKKPERQLSESANFPHVQIHVLNQTATPEENETQKIRRFPIERYSGKAKIQLL